MIASESRPSAARAERVSVVVPNWNGLRWLPGLLESIAGQRQAPAEVIVIDNGSADGSLEYLRSEHPETRVLALGSNTGFAHAANRGIEAAGHEFVALLNPDIVLAPDWIESMAGSLAEAPRAAAVACKMLSFDRPEEVYDAGDVLRRDGVCEQRGRFRRDEGQWDAPGEVFGACAGAALYRRSAVLGLGGFDERFFAYLEDVDLALRLRLAGWICRYEPVVAWHAGESSSGSLPGGHWYLVARNTLILSAKAFPLRWLPLLAYRQAAWAWHAYRDHRLGWHLRGVGAALRMLPGVLDQRRALRSSGVVAIEVAVPPAPIRGSRACGHPHASRGRPERGLS